MNRLFRRCLPAIAMAVLWSPADGAEDVWPKSFICAAGVQTYFFLREAPRQIGNVDGWIAFRSKSGATYDCQLRGKSISLRWRNDSGPMASESTQFQMSGTTLTVQPQGLSSVRFRRTQTGYVALD